MTDDGDHTGYVHDPSAVRESGDGAAGVEDSGDDDPTFDWRGWILVGVVVFAFLVVPGLILVAPTVVSLANLPYIHTLVALPMVPALILGAVAVWAAVRTRG